MQRFSTLPGLFMHVKERFAHPAHFSHLSQGQWRALSTAEFVDSVERLALGLHSLGVKPGDGIGILADPSPYWLMVDLAAMIAGGTSVPLFPNMPAENLEFEIRDSQMRFLYLAKEGQGEALAGLTHLLENVVCHQVAPCGGHSLSFEEILARGHAAIQKQPGLFSELVQSVQEQDLATILYTSGSTGRPKGVELTQKNLVSQIHDASERMMLQPGTDVILSCLPLAHIFERMVMYYYVSTGCPISITDDPRNVDQALRHVKPTAMTMVPRMLEKLCARLSAAAARSYGLRKRITEAAFARAMDREAGHAARGPVGWFFDKLVYSHVREALGGKLRLVIVGSAALSKPICRFFLNAGIPIYEGYGLTEASPVVATNWPGNCKPHTVGKPFPRVEVRITPDGEILARGPNVMRGYHNQPEATREAIDGAGWLHTGDKGELDRDGYLTITGRLKELFKTSTGKYVAPFPLEQALAEHEFVYTAIVIAEKRNFVTCLIVPDFDRLPQYKINHGFGEVTDQDFFKGYFIHQEMHALLNRINKRLNHWEHIQKYFIVPHPPSIAGGTLTPTLKLKRHVLEKEYENEINQMYEGMT
jgi:long-chain acyl-CoA synthetase